MPFKSYIVCSTGLLERLSNKEAIVCAEGYLLSFERRGYLQAGPYVPEVVLGRPDLVRLQYEEFVHAGSDVVVAFTVRYYYCVPFMVLYSSLDKGDEQAYF